ncbi:MAG: hypothetical protein AAGF26_03855 [Cyanobacteria bacterium P01_G01_bin.49]
MKIIFLIILSLLFSLSSVAETDEKIIIDQVIEAEKTENFCGDEEIDDLEKSRELSQVLAMPTEEIIVELSCNFFAYQGILAYIRYQIDQQGSVSMTQFKIEKYDAKIGKIKEEKTILGVVLNLNYQDNSISHLTKYRGLSDIGMFYRYQVDLENNKLTLIEQRERDESHIKPTQTPEILPLPDQWPLVYAR